MDKKSTPSRYTKRSHRDTAAGEMSPSRLTLAVIRQFARVYSYDTRLESRLGGIVSN